MSFNLFICLYAKEKEKFKCMIERKDVGGGENWGILEVSEYGGNFYYQIRRG